MLTAVTERDGEQERTVSYEYDVNGNQVKESDSKSQVTTVNEYDAENRLSKAVITMPEPETLPGDTAEPESGAATGQASEPTSGQEPEAGTSTESGQEMPTDPGQGTDGADKKNQVKTITQENLYNGDGQRIRKSEGRRKPITSTRTAWCRIRWKGRKRRRQSRTSLGLKGTSFWQSGL